MKNPVKYTVRDAILDDVPLIADFNCKMALETEGRTLEPGVATRGVRAVLNDAGLGRYWIADHGGKSIGQIMVSHEWSDWRNAMIWWIQSVYVDTQYRRMGVFSALYDHVRSLQQSDPTVCGLRLYVAQTNTRAQDTYRSKGMSTTAYRVMETDFTVMKEH